MRKLDKKDIEDILALTPMQEGILFHYLKAPGSEVYFEQLSLEISGKIELKLFEKALDFVIRINEMLRTLFRWEKLDTPLQIILKRYKLPLEYYDFTKTDPGEMKKRLQQLKNNDRKSKFQLDEVPFRVILCRVNEYKYVMIVSNHHILYDGWSTGIILNEFFTAYHDLCNGKKLVKSIKTKFRTFIQWLQDQDVVKQEKFWRNYLKNFDTQTGLPVKISGKEKDITVTETKNCQARFEKDIKDKLEGFVKNYRITLATLLYSTWGIVLQGYNNIDDVVFGTTTSGRAAKVPGIEDMVGLFINTIPLRVQTFPHEKTEDLLSRIDKALQMRENYETASLVKIREYSEFAYNEELFDSIVVIENYPLGIKRVRGNSKLFVESHAMIERSHYNLAVTITITDDIEVIFRYNNKLFEQWIIERLCGHFLCVVRSMIKKPGEEVSAIELVGEGEKRQLLIHFNKTGFDCPGEQPIDELFTGQAAKIPDHMALVGKTGILGTHHSNTNDVYISYRELNEQSNQLAYAMREKGAASETIVGIMLERSVEMIVGIMAVLKSGGAYLPIDPDYPSDRIAYMLSDSGAKVLVTVSPVGTLAKEGEKLRRFEVKGAPKTIFIDSLEFSNFSTSQLLNFSTSSSLLAYVIYTSGSTGKPKGVMVEHRNINYLVYGLRERIYKNYGENLRVCLVSPFVFDASVKQVFGALLLGNCLYIVPEEARINGEALFEFYKKHRVDISDGTPAHLQLLMENQGKNCPGVRDYLIGGEPLSREIVDGFLNRYGEDDPGITNVYGPTECTVDAASYQVNRENIGLLHTIPIGNPLPNCRIYVLAGRNKLQPIGVPGELCIMGKGVSRGYLNQPGLTAEKFLPVHDWSNRLNRSYKSYILYRTGDLGRWRPKGDIEFLGRLDQQVKIRGHRIETGEIEHQLLNYRGLKKVVVTVKSSESAEHFLCAYFVSNSPGAIEISQLRQYLQQKLPDYMIPSYFVNLEKIPLTASGKVDRKSLPQPDITSSKRYVMPGNEIEAALVDIWAEILEIDKNQIGIDDIFFELGGHSLKFAGLIGRIHKKLNIKVPFIKIFKIPTIRELAEYIHKEKERKKNDEKTLPGEKKEYYRLSSAQRRLFVLQQMDTGCTAYNITGTLRVEGKVEKEKFAGVFIHLICRHESLRTSFHMAEDQPVQKIHDEVDFEIEYDQSLVKGQGRSGVSSPIKVEKIIRDFIRPFDLSQAPLMRVGLIKEGEQKHILIVDMHHIISDGLSMEIFVKDFGVLYNGEDLPLLPATQYKDYAEWETGQPVQKRLKKQKEYWSKEFEGEVPVLMLPTDFSRPIVQGFAGHTLRFKLFGEQTQALKAAAFNKKTTLNVVLLTLYTIFLSKITGQEDIVVGVPSLARPHVETETIIGMFANSLALRNFPRGEKSIGEFITEVKARTLEAFANQDYPYENLVETLVIKRDTGQNPLFDTMFVFQEGEIKGLDIPGLNIKLYEYEGSTSKFDLTLLAFEGNETLFFAFEYSTNLFKKETIERFFHYFKAIVSYLPGNINRKLNDIEIVTGEEKRQILEEFNDTASQYPTHKTLHELFAEQVEQTPERTALVGPFKINYKKTQNDTNLWQEYPITHRVGSLLDSDTFANQLTYNRLNREAEKLALVLKEKGVLRDTIIAIKMERSVEMIVGIMGILKAGGAYLPIDSEYPEERIKYMLCDSNSKLLLTTNEITSLSSASFSSPQGTHSHLHLSFAPAVSVAYIIYTSGSTGKPKGVPVEHFSVVNLAYCQGKQFAINERDRILQFSSICFDASVEQIFIAFFNGAVLVLVDKNTLLDHIKFENFIICQSITHIHAVPSFLNGLQFKDTYNYGLKRIISGGDVCPVGLAERWSADYDFYNEYGPTETTVTSIEMLIEAVDKRMSRLPVGKPISNTRVYVLDRVMNLVPIGVVGDLFIGGAGVSRGYLNNPELTKEKFEHDFWDYQDDLDEEEKDTSKKYNKKFLRGESRCFTWAVFSKSAPPGCRRHRIYKTGDLAQWLPGGNIEFFGRKDSQVKIRGFRIELGEIENRLLAHADIKEVVVLCKEDRIDDKYLCAYIVPYTPGAFNKTASAFLELREYLSQTLPEYMLPRYFMELAKIPLTSNGKVDQKSLSAPAIESEEDFAAPRDNIETKLVEIWSGILGEEKEKINIDANFFHLGGHSLKATILASRIHKELNIDIPLTVIFKTPRIRGLATYIKEAAGSKHIPVEPAEKKDYYPLSSAQRRLYILQQMDDKGGISYNMPSVWQVEGDMDAGKFLWVFQQLARRHESLRNFFTMVNDEPVQRINEESGSSRIIVEVTAGAGDGPQVEIETFIRPFDLSQAPLLRVGLIKTGEQKHILMMDMHHIISDGLSTGILVKDFTELYAGKSPPPLKLQYKDYSQWHNGQAGKDYIKEQETYWLKQFAGETPLLNLPTDYPRPNIQNFPGRILHFGINKEETAALESLARQQDVTLFMLLLSVYTVFLAKVSSQEDIVVGTPIAARRHTDLEGIIGMFVNTLALRNFPVGEMAFHQYLAKIKESTIKAFENQDYLYEYLVEQVALERDIDRNPLFDTMFVLQNMDTRRIRIPGLKIMPYSFESRISKFDLTLTAVEIEDVLAFTFEYCTNLFKEETIRRFTEFFKRTVSTVLENHETRLSWIEVITPEEKKRVLLDFNDTAAGYPRDKTIHQLFEEQVSATPSGVALVGSSKYEVSSVNRNGEPVKLTHGELNRKSDQVAQCLRENGVQTDTIVGIMMERSIEMIIGILGILKAGGAYLPIDPGYPEERKQYMLADSGARILVSELSGVSKVSEEAEVVKPGELKEEHPNHLTHPTHLCYVIYTSGSTGRPKGVAVEHSQLVNFVYHMYNRYDRGVDFHDRCLGLTNIMFDVSVWEFFLPLSFGAGLILLPKQKRFDVFALAGAIVREAITLTYIPPALLGDVCEQLTAQRSRVGLNKMLVGVEPIRDDVLEGYMQLNPGMKIINGYGPTETTICATSYNYTSHQPEGEIVPIGLPLSNNRVFLLDAAGHIVPQRIPGEICISGTGVSRGYINNPELTAEKFVLAHNSWLMADRREKKASSSGKLPMSYELSALSCLYRTGDLARWLPDGNIEFLGRMDHQVKVRGFRIELGEIENQLLTHEKIKEAIVIAREDNNDKYLCAYMVAKSGETNPIDQSGLREYLSKRLPDYMVPSCFVQLDNIPLTPNGKIDRKALPEPDVTSGKNYIPPRNEAEDILAGIWSEVLGIEKEKIGVTANFFELGGHSLKATIMIVKIHKALKVKLSTAKIFTHPTIRSMANILKEHRREHYIPLEVIEKKEYYPLSSAQKRMFVLQQMDPQSTSYNMPIMVILGAIEKDRVEYALKRLLGRHESLRTCFRKVGKETVQRVYDEVEFKLIHYMVGEVEAKSIVDDFIKPFDLNRTPLFRANLIQTAENRYILLTDMHHILVDGFSTAIIAREFTMLYHGNVKDLAPLKFQYKDFSHWQGERRRAGAMDVQEEYWIKKFSGDLPVLNLPTDFSRPTTQRFNGSGVKFYLDIAETAELRDLAKSNGTTVFMTVISIFAILISKLSDQEDIIIGTPVSGRRHADLETIVGNIMNTLPIRCFPRRGKSFSGFLQEVKEHTLEDFENQDYQFEDLVGKILTRRDKSRNPIFDVMFNMQDQGEDGRSISNAEEGGNPIDGDLYGFRNRISKFDLQLFCVDAPGIIDFIFEYSIHLFKEETIENFITYFKDIVRAVLDNPHIKMEDITISHGLFNEQISMPDTNFDF